MFHFNIWIAFERYYIYSKIFSYSHDMHNVLCNIVNIFCTAKRAFVLSLIHTFIIMDNDLDPKVKEVLEKIGAQVRKKRKKQSNPMDYKEYAKENLPIGQNTYLRIEQGNGDYHISNLIHVLLKYPDLKISEFFEEAGL